MNTREAFPTSNSQPAESAILDRPAYRDLIAQLMRDGESEGEARCGAIQIAGRTVAAAFVGAVTSALVLAEPLRVLHGGRRYEVASISLRAPEYLDVAEDSSSRAPIIPFSLSSTG